MGKLLFILSLSFGSLAIGYAVKACRVFDRSAQTGILERASKAIKLIAMFALNPIPILDSFWRLSLDFGGLLVFPLLGLLSLASAGAAAVLLNRLLRIPPKRAASVFVSSMFTNIVTLGGLVGFVFFGYEGYGLVQLYAAFFTFMYYGIGFPVSQRLSIASARPFALSPRLVFERPYVFVPLLATVGGLLLNLFHVRPVEPLTRLSSLLIPFIAGLMGFSIGLSLYLSKIGGYLREILLVLFIKFLVVPLILLPLGAALGLQEMADGLPFKILVLVAFMPVAFNALVPPALYEFDLDLANSAWIVTTMSLVVVIPALSLVLGS